MAVRWSGITPGTTVYHGRHMVDVPLPGDESEVLKVRINEALRRDYWWNVDEAQVYMCTRFQLFYGTSGCLSNGCRWCGNQTWNITEDYDRWP